MSVVLYNQVSIKLYRLCNLDDFNKSSEGVKYNNNIKYH